MIERHVVGRVGIIRSIVVWVVDRTVPVWMGWVTRPRLWNRI